MKRLPVFTIKILILAAIIAILFFLSFMVGLYPIPPKTVFDIIRSRFMYVEPYFDETLVTVVLEVRLPRIIMGILVGGALSISGASYQTLFKNPMVSPDLLGVSAGAGFGAALALLNQGSWYMVQLSALLFGILAVVMAYFIGKVFGNNNITVLVLAGVVVSSLFQSLLSIVKTRADTDNTLASITFWLMGSLGRVKMADVLMMLPASGLSLGLLFFFRHKINALCAGEEEAMTMGVNVPLTKLVVVTASTLITACAVSVCGIVGWVGMVVPHIARMYVGASYSKLAAASFLIGGILLLLIDNIIRGIPGIELPLGVLTSLIGTPLFVVLLAKAKRAWA
ncbi:iron ABC transporter permease [Christensenellaceae bacterium OttesenSCG-928-M15]|nr:iron ABC transporter permease [Christensenellaceae bacterium OttesenSCG-928-M15]